jgi:hypothetical protein
MYPLGMDRLMIELVRFHEKLWRENHPEHDFDTNEVEIAKGFLHAAGESGLARLVKGREGDLIWQATPRLFHDLGKVRIPRPAPDEEVPEDCAGAERQAVQITISEKLIRDVDWMTAELMDHAEDMERAIEIFHGLRQRAFDLLEAIGEDPLKGFRPKQPKTPEEDLSSRLPENDAQNAHC